MEVTKCLKPLDNGRALVTVRVCRPQATAPHLDSTDLNLPSDKFLSLGGRSEEIS
jgi:hypothetical protein